MSPALRRGAPFHKPSKMTFAALRNTSPKRGCGAPEEGSHSPLEGSGREHMDADRILGCAAPIVGMGGKKPPGDNAVKLLETDAFRSAF